MTGKSKPEVWTSERCFIAEVLNDAAWPEMSIARCRVEPGVTTQLHTLSVHEVYIIESGHGAMHLGNGDPFDVGPGDVVTIPKQTEQSITNTGNADLVFVCVCTPRFSPDTYTSLE